MALNYFECKVCGFDSDEAKMLSPKTSGMCPLCLSDCGHANAMTYRAATPNEMEKLSQKES